MSWFKLRSNILLVFFILLMFILIVRLFILTGIESGKWVEAAESNTIRSIITNAPRGEIYDRNGILIAGNQPTFVVTFAKNDLDNDGLNQSISRLLTILEAGKEKTIDNLPIKITSTGKFYYTYQMEIREWLKSHGLSENYTAQQAFEELRRQNNIDPGMDKFDAQKRLMQTYGVYPPIAVTNYEYTQERDKRNFLALYGIDLKQKNFTAEGAFRKIKKDMNIDEALSDEEARKIMTIRYELTAQGSYKYIPVKVATGLKKETIIKVQENLQDMPGVDVVTDTIRYYPQGNTASHVVGYLGRMSEERWTEKFSKITTKKYQRSDMIGLEGIEQSQEEKLKGEDGVKQVQVNALGETMHVISEEKARKGQDIVLSIDLRLQQVAEDALLRSLKGVRVGGMFSSKYGSYKFSTRAPNAEVGAAVVLNVKTGEPLAIASYPDFDPSLFAEGISRDDWNNLQGKNPRDPLSPRPLYNVAAMTAVQPGSTFKPLTAITALEAGLDSNRYLRDAGRVILGGTSYGCMLWNTSKGNHGSVNLFSAMQVSCNYYFFDIGSGRDWANNGASLGYDIDIDKIMGYARQFGLGVKTGIEIPETTVSAPSAEKKLSTMRKMLENYIIGQAEYVFESAVLKNNTRLMENVRTITSWIEENPKVDEIENRLLRLGVKSKESANLAGEIKYSYFNFAKWTTGDELNIAIGQGENAFTPLQLARYAATIGNGGKMNELGMIKAVEGEGITRRKASVQAKVKSKNLKDVITGMRRVVTGGTLSNLTTLRVTTAGKTGTAQRSGRINPPDEVKYIKDHLSGINSALSWAKVQKEMNRLMKDFSEIYDNPNVAVRKAVMNLSGRKFDSKRIDAFKGEYDDFAWIMAVAPAEKPEIAVVCLIVQGGASRNAIPVVKELIGQYFDLKEEDREENRTIDYNQFFKNDKSKGRVRLEYLKKGTPDLGTESAIQPGDEGAAIQADVFEDTDGTAMREADEATGETETARKDAID